LLCGPFESVAGQPSQRLAAQLLSYEKGYVFLTSGEVFRTAPDVKIVDAEGAAAKDKPSLGTFVRLTFDAGGSVTEIEVASTPFKPEALLAALEGFSVLPPPVAATSGPNATEIRNSRVPVAFVVEVPTTTLGTDDVYMETAETSWNPLAIRLDRIDAQHFRVVLSVPLGSRFRYLYTRGNSRSIELGTNGLERSPRQLLIRNVRAYAVADKVEHWGDEAGNGLIANPQASPTPFNPAPYPNLPGTHINPAKPRE
jgi:hypothetical protein